MKLIQNAYSIIQFHQEHTTMISILQYYSNSAKVNYQLISMSAHDQIHNSFSKNIKNHTAVMNS